MLFDKICRKNGITHRLTAPASPTTTGKVERFHQTLRRELLDGHEPFPSIEAAQAALDAWVSEYNADRPHQALDGRAPVTPADRFTPVPPAQRELIDLWLPPALTLASSTASPAPPTGPGRPAPAGRWLGGPVEFERVVPPSGNMWVAERQFWLGPARAGVVIRFWADCELIHLSAGGARIKTLRSHLSVNDLAKLAATGAVPAGPAPLPPAEDGQAVEVERPVSRGGLVCLGPHRLLAAEILGGQLVGIRIEPATLMFYDPTTRVLLRTRPNPLTPAQVARLAAPAPPGHRPGHRPSPSGCSAAPPPPASSWSAGRRSPSAAPTPGRPSRSRSPTPPWPSNSTTPKPAWCAAPPPSQSVTSKPTGRGRSPQFPRVNVNHHLAQKRQARPGTRHDNTRCRRALADDPAGQAVMAAR